MKQLFYVFTTFSFLFCLRVSAEVPQVMSFEDLSKEVQEKLSDKSELRFNYCVKNTMTCRTLVLLKDKKSGQLSEMFFNNFFSSERAVAITGYFLKNENGTYRAYSDGTFNGKIDIDAAFEWDREIEMSFDQKGFPTAHNLRIKTLGTSKYSISTLSFNEERSSIHGTRYDEKDQKFSEPYSVIYERVQ